MKNEAHYKNPVNLFISKNYDDAETAQEFIKDMAGEQLSVSKGRNGDYLYVSIEGADEDIDAFLEVYKDEYGDIVKDCGVDGWVTPEDTYYASVEGKKELLGESQKNERGNDDYLQEVWDSLEGAWDKDMFDMSKGYDSEYDSECITITSKDNEEVRAKIYIEDYEGRHPVAFNVVYRYPGDKGVGVMGTYEFQSTDMEGLGEEVFDYFDEIQKKVGEAAEAKTAEDLTTGDEALKQMQTTYKQYKGKTTGEIAADIRYDVATALDMPADEVDDVMQSFGLDNIYSLRANGVSPKAIAQKILRGDKESKKSESFDMNKAFFDAKKAITDWTKNQKHKTLEWIYTDGRKSPSSLPSGIWDFEWDTGDGMATAEIKVSPYETRTNSWNDSLDFALKSGPDGKYMYYTSAEDVLYALDKLIRDTEFMGEAKKDEVNKVDFIPKTHLGYDVRVSVYGENGRLLYNDAYSAVTSSTYRQNVKSALDAYNSDRARVLKRSPEKADEWVEPYRVVIVTSPDGENTARVYDTKLHWLKDEDWRKFGQQHESKTTADETSWALEYLEETAKEKGLKVSTESPTEICITVGTFPHQDHIFVTDDAPGKDNTSLELYVPAAHINTSGLTLQDVLDYLDDPIGKRDAVQLKNGNRLGKVEAKKSERAIPVSGAIKQKINDGITQCLSAIKEAGAVANPIKVTNSTDNPELSTRDTLVYAPSYVYRVSGMERNFVGVMFHVEKDGQYGQLFIGWDKKNNSPFVWAGGATFDSYDSFCNDFKRDFSECFKTTESKKSESLTLKQKELKDMARYGEAEDITTISDAEAKELKKKGIETVGVSRGVYGMNGALLRDNEGNKYVITARSSNLFYFV